MPITDKSLHENFIRGADTFWHRANLFTKNSVRILVVFLLAWLLLSLLVFLFKSEAIEREAAWANRKAALANFFFLKNHKFSITYESNGEEVQRDVPAQQLVKLTAARYQSASAKLWDSAALAFLLAVGAAVAVVLHQIRRGDELADDEFLRGAKIVQEHELAAMVEKPSTFKIGKVPIPQDKLLRNIMMTGAMGTGKSQALLYLLDEARRLGIKCVIYDKTGEFTEQFFRDGKDILLNPFDVRCAPWSIFKDIQQDFDYSMLSSFFVPENKNSADPVWDNAARILLEDVFRIVHSFPTNQQTAAMVQGIILRTPLDELAELLRIHGAASAGTINEKNERGSESVRLTLSASPSIRYFNYLPVPVPGNEFSIREWIRRQDDSWLFLSSRVDMHEVIKPFTSLWVELALLSIMTLRPDHSKVRAMFFLDELASLSKMKGLEIAATEARKFGISTFVGLQNLAQIDHIYGNDMAKVLAGNFQTKFILRVEDESTAKRYADQLGKEEILESTEGNSFGAEADRDGVNLGNRCTERHIVMPTEIMRLPDLVGYLKLPGDFPIAQVRIEPKGRPTIAQDFIPRGGLEVGQMAAAVLPTATASPSVPAPAPVPEPDPEDDDEDGDADHVNPAPAPALSSTIHVGFVDENGEKRVEQMVFAMPESAAELAKTDPAVIAAHKRGVAAAVAHLEEKVTVLAVTDNLPEPDKPSITDC